MVRYSFITEDFHFIFLAGLSGAPRACVDPYLQIFVDADPAKALVIVRKAFTAKQRRQTGKCISKPVLLS